MSKIVTRLSPQMLRMLQDVALGLGTHGTSSHRGEHAGRYATARALHRRGLLSGSELTDEGRKALASAGVDVPDEGA
jgi:hypothetical protein